MNDYVKNIHDLFFVAENKLFPYYPPNQVFRIANFNYLLTIGGYISDKNEYIKLMKVLSSLGEEKFIVYENLGVTITDRDYPDDAIIKVESTFEDFEKAVSNFDPEHFSFRINNYFIGGLTNKWGIYICENPTINIIGCTKDLIEKFRDVYNIKDNGLEDLKDFIEREFRSKDAFNTFIKNYNL